ncbi:MAG TPA: DedA family protein [Caldithrix abyssi]|uniref:DedA family protein n=1 Tax=Caldithrix abyssi TaxID=187145 RepID=A0A7V1PVF9_CALAY|nr:DedA family protein [Caldithrix abyssi]
MIAWIEHLIAQVDPLTAYLLLFVSAFVENTFPPIPGDTVTVIGAYLITTGKLSFVGVWVSTTLGSVLGFFTMFIVGSRFGTAFIEKGRRSRYFQPEQIVKTQIWFDKYGYWIIAANRFLSGTRSVISLFAGIFKLKWMPVLFLATVSAFVWNGLLMMAGYLLGSNWPLILDYISQYNRGVIILTVVLVAGFIIYRYMKKRRKKDE